ncbi:uncharacterized protein LOC113501821 isoform X3 [Trichoplusia ni]|uniref:Uncharacterized protein LOC113501821 isoform X3 n=1 Tax=Trichoplusia ni TaxID=7111 RepID=A0A7E5WFH5_TRINI|nr:uncharacterized protein LOC113501821 isoform X3 [Trichoplusia ni]
MNDPWDVKSVLQAGQYVSCMKLNGVPLLPPVLSKECRKEMQYYKLLAKEVEKRISLLQPYILESDSDNEDKTDAPELPESEQGYDLPQESIQAGFSFQTDLLTSLNSIKNEENPIVVSPRSPIIDISNNFTSNVLVESVDSRRSPSPQFIIDLSLSINETGTGKNLLETVKIAPRSPPIIDLPERDYNCTRRIMQKVITEKEVITEVETQRNTKQKEMIHEVTDFHFSRNKNNLSDNYANIHLAQDGPSSLSSKSFTGSLNDLHSESVKDLRSGKLIRQRSYTLLKPSPQLLAHLEVQSINTGIDMTHISMSESYSNLSSPGKKRRSWDLESAKVKWSSMALELKQTNVAPNVSRNASNKSFVKAPAKKPLHGSPPRTRSMAPEKSRRNISAPKPTVKSDPIPKSDAILRQEHTFRSEPASRTEPMLKGEALRKHEGFPKSDPITRPDHLSKTRNSISPIRNTSHRTYVKDTPKTIVKKSEHSPQKLSPSSKSDSEDPATRVRELYEKIQNQQLLQMATLVEKQKREQLLLQQVFEEQNNLLFKQLKTICPKSPIEVKEAWGEKHPEGNRGPVSLSQLINYKSPEQSSLSSPVSATLTDTNKYLNHCNNVLKKSRDITNGIKKPPVKSRSQNGTKIVSPRTQPEVSKTRTNSPTFTQKNVAASAASRKLNYDTSACSDRDYEPILTDRTNDTLADLNVTFPSDNSDECPAFSHRNNNSIASNFSSKEIKTLHGSVRSSAAMQSESTDNAIRNMERTIHNSIKSTNARLSKATATVAPTPEEQAAATKIVAHAKGYLVRRLMKTDRVQATVQTIKDALLCALQLHQDREGIRGADVDLHRRLIQQITAACYSLHDTFIASTASERCGMIAADRGRRRSLAARQGNNSFRQTDVMSQSHTGAFPARASRPASTSQMTQSNYETFSGDKRWGSAVSAAARARRPWR